MAVAELLSDFKAAREDRAKLDQVRKDFISQAKVDEDTGAIVLATAEDQGKWVKIKEGLEVLDHAVEQARLEVNAERYETEVNAELLELSKLEAAAGNKAGHQRPDEADESGSVGLGKAMKEITMATGPTSKEGSIELPMLSMAGGTPAYRDWETDDPEADADGMQEPTQLGLKAAYCKVVQPAGMDLKLSKVRAPVARQAYDVSKGTGGLTFPTIVAPAVMRMFDEARLPMYTTIYNTTHGNTMLVRRRNTLGGLGSTGIPWGQPPPHVREGNTIANLEPTYDSTSFMSWAVKYLGTLTYEVMRDLGPENIASEVTGDMMMAMGLYLAWLGVKGSGAMQGEGISTKLDDGTDVPPVSGSADDHVPTVKELSQMLHGLAERYAANAKFGTSWANIGDLRTLVGTDGHPLLQDDFSGEWQGKIFGRPVFASPGFNDFDDANKASLIVGDWRCMAYRFVKGMRLDRSEDANFKEDETVWRLCQDYDVHVIDVHGFRTFNSKDTN